MPPLTIRRLPRSLQVGYEPAITICLGDEVQQIPQSQLLQHVWTDGLYTECHECGLGFSSEDDDAAKTLIRTITFDNSECGLYGTGAMDMTQEPLTVHPIRIFNRHFQCLKDRNVRYIPISHAWHPEVSQLQNDHPDTIDLSVHFQAVRAVYQTPVKTLQAIAERFGPAMEIWHDYLSVPQWLYGFQTQLLQAIPDIYSWPGETTPEPLSGSMQVECPGMVMHLDDVTAVDLAHLHNSRDYPLFLEGLSRVTQSRWFERMWVTLEYLQAETVSILTGDWKVFDVEAGQLLERTDNAVSKYIKQKGSTAFHDDSNARGCRYATKVCWTDMESWKKWPDKYRTLGSAVYILGQKQCRDMRDYHFALAGMIGLRINKRHDRDDDSERFFRLAKTALGRGDYTPLLFTPIVGEQSYPAARWLHGHSSMTEEIWDLGPCHEKAYYTEILRSSRVQPQLQMVGIVEEWRWIDVDVDPKVFFQSVVAWIVKGSGASASAFCAAIDRIFPEDGNKALYTRWDGYVDGDQTATGPDDRAQYHYSLITPYLERFIEMLDGSPLPLDQIAVLAEVLIAATRLDRKGKHSADSRLNMALAEVEGNKSKKSLAVDGIAQVWCSYCKRRSLFRLLCWTPPESGVTEVFRIPNLLYDETVPQGVGLVVTNGVINGKMSNGTPACNCLAYRRVDIH
ncbi:uncharacterized protein B0H64DRAFT_402080 [Chaetomium fimeti]|uniref:Heterokaryon incompatibility domain-containing protein n=1 Tax=Chaetomium fimeti TaxID=1854472 RepID=A0AAE0HFW9_9PEZI|nr:hypothetical protein B0H64DRAFT_402080 [Chaetomium fimeti]